MSGMLIPHTSALNSTLHTMKPCKDAGGRMVAPADLSIGTVLLFDLHT